MKQNSYWVKWRYILCDGTFKSTPKPFQQVFIIYGDLGSSSGKTNVVPLVFALMSDNERRRTNNVAERNNSVINKSTNKTYVTKLITKRFT